MEQRILTARHIESFRTYLMTEEKSAATVEKYLRDVRKFAWDKTGIITRETVLDYKRRLRGGLNSKRGNPERGCLFLSCVDRKDTTVKALRRNGFCCYTPLFEKASGRISLVWWIFRRSSSHS